jgi:thiosulfate/3-mercaptopyruvate sulfurtransferase
MMIQDVLIHAAALALATLQQGPVAAVQPLPAPVIVSTDWLARRLRDTTLVIVHVAPSRADYDAGHIPGARFLPWTTYTRSHDSLSVELPDEAVLDSALEAIGVNDRSRIIITGGPLVNTARLFVTLDYFGLTRRVSLLDGGIEAWREELRPLSTTEPTVRRGSVTLTRTPGRIVDAAWIASRTNAPTSRVAVVDARQPEFFMGTAAGNNPRAGRLPMAANLPFTWVTGALTRFRDRMTLERLLQRAGVSRGDTVVTYCHVGMQASVVYLAARLMGYDTALYDGSFEDWSRRRELPVGTGAPVAPRAIVR